MKNPEWYERALCRDMDPEWWFPNDRGATAVSRMAILICRQCDVAQQCLQTALDHNEPFGIWGGLTAAERRALPRTKPAYCQRCGIPHTTACLRGTR